MYGERRIYKLPLLLLLLATLSGCSVIADIFRVGFWTGVILVLVLVALVYYLLKKMGRKP